MVDSVGDGQSDKKYENSTTALGVKDPQTNHHLSLFGRDGKNHDFFKKIENIEKIENIGYFRYISDFFDIYPIHI